MKIAIDISQIIHKGTGVSRFVDGLIRSIIEYDKRNQWSFFFSSLRGDLDPEITQLIKEKKFTLYHYKLPPTILSFLWNTIHHLNVEKFIGKHDWFITSDWTEGPSTMKKATIVHDLVYLKYPNTVHPKILQTQQKRMRWIKKESKVIFTDSKTTKNDLSSIQGMDGKNIVVNYPGVNLVRATKEDQVEVLKKFGLQKQFILTVGKIEPRKNIGRLIEAFQISDCKNIDLVIVGQQGWDKEISKSQSEKKNVRFLNYINDVELSSLYSACLFFIYPSLYEGFGYPVVEAMIAGAPVATSNNSSLKEIGENAAYLFDPQTVDEIKMSIERLVNDIDLRNKLAKLGIIRGQDFRWKNYYDKMIQVLERN